MNAASTQKALLEQEEKLLLQRFYDCKQLEKELKNHPEPDKQRLREVQELIRQLEALLTGNRAHQEWEEDKEKLRNAQNKELEDCNDRKIKNEGKGYTEKDLSARHTDEDK
jgi:hypothetical protein